MKTPSRARVLLAGAAMAGLLGGTAIRLQAAITDQGAGLGAAGQQLADNSTSDKHGCKGQNGCKGQGGCMSGDNGCKGKNSCKGKGGCATNS